MIMASIMTNHGDLGEKYYRHGFSPQSCYDHGMVVLFFQPGFNQ